MSSRAQGGWSRVAFRVSVIGSLISWLMPGVGSATHEADHRFTVEGFVCEFDGGPAKNTQVVVKDTRVNVGQSVETDERGYYRATLHLHNDNLGDPLLVSAKREEQRIKVQFDPKDLESERKVRLDFGAGCQQAAPDEVPDWVYYSLAAVGFVTLATIAARAARQHRLAERGKGKKRQRK